MKYEIQVGGRNMYGAAKIQFRCAIKERDARGICVVYAAGRKGVHHIASRWKHLIKYIQCGSARWDFASSWHVNLGAKIWIYWFRIWWRKWDCFKFLLCLFERSYLIFMRNNTLISIFWDAISIVKENKEAKVESNDYYCRNTCS